eukprot:146382-Pyramimonas_sp.AAC.1
MSAPPQDVLQWAWVLYAGERRWHQRRIWGRLEAPLAGRQADQMLLSSTPDHNVFEENYSRNSPDILAV